MARRAAPCLTGGRAGEEAAESYDARPDRGCGKAPPGAAEKLEEHLDAVAQTLCGEFKSAGFIGHDKITKFPELAWEILQHYEVCPTPLLDVTSSLRVAASFALDEVEEGYLYAFGFPHPNGTITYSSDQELLNIRLLSIARGGDRTSAGR